MKRACKNLNTNSDNQNASSLPTRQAGIRHLKINFEQMKQGMCVGFKLMNKTILLSLIISVGGFYTVHAQTDPGTANLIHQYTFDDGTANDANLTSPVNGKLENGATILNNSLNLATQGQFLSFQGSSLKFDTLHVITQEIWFTPKAGANTGYTMLSYFGNSSNGLGYNYISTSVARGDNISRTAISNGTYDSEISADGLEYDDGKLHHLVSIISLDSVILYIDGKFISGVKNNIPLSTINQSMAFLGKGGYTNDPTWIGQISKFSIYNKSLTASEVKFLFEQDAEQSPLILSSKIGLSFDEFYTKESIGISGINLTDSIIITVPEGITSSVTILAHNITNESITITYNGTAIVDGYVELSSNSTVLKIPVKSYTNDCFTETLDSAKNLISNPIISSLEYFAGWGNRSINADHDFVYCGATSGKVEGTNGGSLDVNLTGKLQANTMYQVKAKVYSMGGNFQIGVFGWSDGQPDKTITLPATNSWQNVDFTFLTGTNLGSSQGIFFNNYGLSGTTGYIDNWEMYAIPKVYTSEPTLNFPTPGSKNILVRGVNLIEDISIIAPAGFSVYPNNISVGSGIETVTVSFDSDVPSVGYIYFESGSVKDSMYVFGSLEPTIVLSKKLVLVDEIDNTSVINVTAYNLNNEITFTAPEGISFSPTSLVSNASNESVTITYDGITNSSGIITLTSGLVTTTLELIAERNDECFVSLYNRELNLIEDATCNSYIKDGWGSISINSNPDFVYCGSRSGKVSNDGSLNRNLNEILKPNTEYRLKAMVYKESPIKGNNLGHVTYTLACDSSANPEPFRLITEAMDSACSYYSKYTPFIENIYVYFEPGIPTAQASFHGSIGFGANTRYMWVGTAIHEMAHYFGSGTSDEWHALLLSGVWTGEVANELVKSLTGDVLHGDNQHYWPFGINQKEEITGLGSIEIQDKALADAVKIIKAMLVDDAGLPTNNSAVGVGVYGWEAGAVDIYHEVKLSNSWQEIDFTFTTGETLDVNQGVFFNRGTGYIDNWELYELPVDTVSADLMVNRNEARLYVQDNKIMTEFDLATYSDVNIFIYDVQGKLISVKKYNCQVGFNKIILNAPINMGINIIKVVSNDFSISRKVIIK